MTSMLCPRALRSCTTREALHHHHMSVGYHFWLAGAVIRFLISSHRQKASEPNPLQCKTSKMASRLPMIAMKREPNSP